MTGFGAAFTDSSTWLLGTKLTASQQAAVLTSLFSPACGIGLSFMRIPMGASDFIQALPFYTYDDLPSGQADPALASFSISHDQAYTIGVIKAALAINPAIKLFANPWSRPPG
jgi:glucosylceramidase